MKPFSLGLVSATALSMAVSVPAALAQDTSPENVEDVVVIGRVLYADQVTALKAPTPILNVPQSLSIVTAAQISERGFDSLGDIITYTPGVSMSQGEGHRDSVVFRGVRSTADFYIDGMRDDVQYYRPLYNIEQVEILRGPNALLFGRGGTGGILNRVTKKGVIGENFTNYQASVDTFGAVGFQIDGNFAAGEKTAIRVNAMYEHLNSHRDFYDGDRYGFNPTAKIQISDATTLDISYEYINHERFIDRGIPTGADGRPVKALKKVVFGDPEINTTELEAHLLRASLQHDFSESFKGIFGVFYGHYDKLYQNFYASGYNQADTPDEVTLDGYVDTTTRKNLVLSANMVGEFATGSIQHTLIFGGEYINTSSDQARYNSLWNQTNDDNEIFSIARPLSLRGGVGINALGATTVNDFSLDLNDDTRVSIDVISAYVQDQVQITEWLDIVAGIRFDSFDIEVFNVPANDLRDRKDEEFSPRLGVILKPRENISVYASFSETFLPRSGEQFANINGSNNALDPDVFKNLEAGLKWDFEPGLSLTAAVFEIKQSSPQVADNDSSTLDVIKSKIKGFEIQLQGQITDFWFISVGYSYLDGQQVNRGGPTGLRPRELPEHMFSIWNDFQITDKLGLGIGMTYQDQSFVNNSNSAVLPSYVRVDAAAYYELSDSLRLQLNIENLTDETYFPNAHSTHQVTVGAPMSARFSIMGSF